MLLMLTMLVCYFCLLSYCVNAKSFPDAYGDEVKAGGGFATPLTRSDSIQYIKKLSAEAHSLGMAMGLKNAENILTSVQNHVQFAVNEQCATYYGGCSSYESFLRSGKPVFHIEYAIPQQKGSNVTLKADNSSLRSLNSTQLESLYCLESGIGNRRWLSRDIPKKFSTVIKTMDLSKWVMYCDGSWVS
jgi:Glycoside-hydrolase family GH114